MITDAELREIFVSAPVSKTELEVIELSASWFSKTYYLQNQVAEEISVTLETSDVVDVDYVPMNISQSSSNGDLNDSKSITIQYVNDIVATEMDNYNPLSDDKPILSSRLYTLYRDGTVSDIKAGPIKLPINELTRTEEGTSITASSRPVNNTGTGEIATVERAPMLRGFLL